MPHKCMKCGREFRDGSVEILKGCPSCGGKKFVYVSDRIKNDDILREKTVAAIAHETKQEVLEVRPESSPANNPADILERVESVRIMGKGKYELNLERMAESQDVIIGMGTDGRYLMDLASMSKPRKKR
ncbi:MAG TPA: Zn-ribbon domain-containing protein [Methanocorpusculum sp.]|nr:Zn-ribbon domain-containing protein [Methanocorpusculum sp.]HJJ45616.1 Zn-ribbon domain-containing protein [Methanocorpusculum sp.]